MTPAAAERRGLLTTFSAFGAFWGSWAAVLPDVRERSGLDDGSLGLALGVIAVAALPAMPLAGRVMDRYGPRLLLPGVLVAFAAVDVLLGLAARPVALVGALLLLGVATGVLDVSLNAATAAWERLEGRRLMSAAHGFFSLGVLVGAGVTGAARGLGAGPPAVLSTVAGLVLLTALSQPSYRRTDPGAAPPLPRGERRLAPLLLGLGAVVGASFLLEDAVSSWSALHLERTLDAPPVISGLGPGLFAGAMAAGRLSAQVLVRPGREALAVGVGGLVTGLGVLVLAAAPVAWVGLAGAALAGAGVSVLAPTLLSAVGARSAPGRQGADLALVTAFGYTGFVLGPLAVGVLSGALSLPVALGLLAVLAVGIAAGGPVLLRRPEHASPAPSGAR